LPEYRIAPPVIRQNAAVPAAAPSTFKYLQSLRTLQPLQAMLAQVPVPNCPHLMIPPIQESIQTYMRSNHCVTCC
jgi:hypothetical protein